MTSGDPLPRYADLPELGELGVRHSWGTLAPDSGTLSLASEDRVARAAHEVVTGRTIPLNLAIDAFDPPLFGRDRLQHEVFSASRLDSEDIIDRFNPQASSQLDGLAHVRAREHGYYTGIDDRDRAREALGMHHWAERGIAGRGVLLDFGGTDEAPSDPFAGTMLTAEDLRGAADRQGVEIRPGDILLVRTAWANQYLALDESGRERVTGSWNGLHAGADTAQYLWDSRIALVGSDNPAVECAPGSREIGSLHRRLLPSLGMPLMELLDLEALAAHCRAAGRWEFLFVSVPMNLRGAVSSPANAMAIV